MLFFAAFISIFYLVGFGLLGYGVISAKKSTQAGRWPTTPGKIESCEMTSSSDSDGGTTWQVAVEYTYSVAGQQFTSDRLAFGYGGSSGKASHEEILSKLQQADTVDVRYDPDEPGTSVLSYGVHQSIQFVLAFAVTWLLFCLGFTTIWWVATRTDTVILNHLMTH